jgi:hypothetical protein
MAFPIQPPSPVAGVQAASQLARLFWPDFLEKDGQIFLAWAAPDQAEPMGGSHEIVDRTSLEAAYNHVDLLNLFNVQAVLPGSPEYIAACELGRRLAQMWFQKLSMDYPGRRFRVYYTQEERPLVLFHRVWPEEPYWLDKFDFIPEVRQGRIVVYDTDETA